MVSFLVFQHRSFNQLHPTDHYTTSLGKHASRLEDHDLHTYPCDVCMGLHVGHGPTRETFQRRKKLRKKLNMLARRLDALEREKRQLEIQKLALIAEQAGL